MTVEPARAAGSHTHAGQTYYFCSTALPGAVRRGSRALPRATGHPRRSRRRRHRRSPGGQWTCPMHPEIVRDGPGACPICGMALEPRVVDRRRRPTIPELADMTRRFWISAAATVPLFVLAMAEHAARAPPRRAGRRRVAWLSSSRWRRRSCCGAGGRSSCASAIRSRNRSPNMFTLIGLGVGVAYAVQRGRRARARAVSRRASAGTTAASPSTSSPRRSS